MYFLYSFLYSIALLLLFPFQYLKRPKGLRRKWLREKFGFLDSSLITPKSPLPPFAKGGYRGIIWIHAVSVGEVMAALPLLKRLRKKYPSKGVILSTITDTGQKVAWGITPEGTEVVYLPFDLTLILNKALERVRPEMLITIETELWPNLLRSCKKRGIPVLVLNGRISENSFKGYKKVSFFMKEVLSCIDLFGMQSEKDADRIRDIGVSKDKIRVLGNFKFDTVPPSVMPQWTERIRGPVITAGSTHEGEEELITSIYDRLKEDFPDLNLILAPRHPERFKDVEDMLKSKGIPFIKRSEFRTSNPPVPPLVKGGEGGFSELQGLKGEIILLDSVGELSAIYGISDIAVIGKSFRGYGGQNPLEPAYWGKPIICGPHMENFSFIEDFYRDGAALKVDEEKLHDTLRMLLISPEKAKEIGSKARQMYIKNTGAVEKAMEIIKTYVRD